MKSAAASTLPRVLLSVVVVVFWLAMMYSLVKDKVLPRARATETIEIDLTRLGDNWTNIDDYYRIVNEGTMIGGARWLVYSTVRPIGYRVDLNATLNLRLFGKELIIELEVGIQLDSNFQLSDFESRLDILKTSTRLRGMIAAGNRLLAEVQLFVEDNPGQLQRFVVELEKPVSMIDAIRPLAMRGVELRVGAAYETEVIDPVWQMTRGTMSIHVEAEEVITVAGRDHDALRLRTEFANTVTYAWVDRGGRLLRRQIMPNRPIYMELSTATVLQKYAKTLEALTPVVSLKAEDFAGVPPTPLTAIDLSGIFDALSIIPEYEPR